MKQNNSDSKLTQKQVFFTPKVIWCVTLFLLVIFEIDSVLQKNSIIVDILIACIFLALGCIAHRATQKPGAFTHKVAEMGFWKATLSEITGIFSAQKAGDNINTRRKRNLR